MGTVKREYHSIGVQLGIPEYKLKEFAEERDRLSATINYWLEGNVTGDDAPPISWSTIVNALEYIDKPQLAKEIKEKYCQKQGQATVHWLISFVLAVYLHFFVQSQ